MDGLCIKPGRKTESCDEPAKLPEVYLNLNVRGMPQSAALAINEYSRRLTAEGRQVCRLGLGQWPFPVPEHVRASLARNARQKDYLAVRGLVKFFCSRSIFSTEDSRLKALAARAAIGCSND